MTPMFLWERQIGQHLVFGVVEQLGHAWEACTQLVSDAAPLLAGSGSVRLDEHGADGGGHHLLRAFGHQAQRIPHEVRASPLPAGALQDRGDGAFESPGGCH